MSTKATDTYYSGLLFHFAVIVAGVAFLVWLSAMPSSEMRSTLYVFNNISALMIAQPGVFLCAYIFNRAWNHWYDNRERVSKGYWAKISVIIVSLFVLLCWFLPVKANTWMNGAVPEFVQGVEKIK